MSPQLLWTIAGLILTVLTLGGVTISSYQSMDSAKTKLVASEVGNIATATKLWMANSSTDGTFNGVNAATMTRYIPDLTVTGTGATSTFTSKADTAVTFTVAAANVSGTANDGFVITATVGDADKQTQLNTNLSGKACAAANTGTGATAAVTYTCKG
jgi:hypothetical protein